MPYSWASSKSKSPAADIRNGRFARYSGDSSSRVTGPDIAPEAAIFQGRIYGYGKYLHKSLSSLKPVPFDPVASKPSPPNIQNSCSPVCAGVVVQ